MWRHPNTLVSIPIWDFYFDISEWHILSARAWTPAIMLHLTNPCTKQKVLILTKPKGKIYKTKSLLHYIIEVHSLNVKQFYLTHRYDLSGATSPGQNGPGSDGNGGVLRIPQIFCLTGVLPSDCFVSYLSLFLCIYIYIYISESTYYTTTSQKIQFLTLLMNETKTIKFPF